MSLPWIWSSTKDLVVSNVERATGRKLTIDGELDLDLSLTPVVVVEDVSFANAAWGSSPQMVTFRRLEIEVELIALLSKEIRVRRLVAIEPVVRLETDSKGVGNWSFGPAAPAASPEAGGATPAIAVSDLRLERARVEFKDGRTGKSELVEIGELTARAEGLDTPLTIALEGAYRGQSARVEGVLGAPGDLLANRTTPVTVKISAEGIELMAKGTIDRPLDNAEVKLELDLKVDSTESIAKLAGFELPAFGPITIAGSIARASGAIAIDVTFGLAQAKGSAKGRLAEPAGTGPFDIEIALDAPSTEFLSTVSGKSLSLVSPVSLRAAVKGQQGRYEISKLDARLGESDLTGSIKADLSGPRPKIVADLTSKRLHLDPLLPPPVETESSKVKDPRVFSSEPLPVEALRAADARIKLEAALIEARGHRIEKTKLSLDLENGRLSVKSAAAYAGGTLAGDVQLDGSKKTPSLRAKMTGRKVALANLANSATGKPLMTGGPVDLDADLRGTGGSVAALMGSLDGKLKLVMGRAEFDNRILHDAGGAGLMAAIRLINPLAADRDRGVLDCGVVRFDVKNGIASTDRGIAVETDLINVAGSGTVNLATEALDLGVKPSPREGVGLGAGQLAGLVRIGGTLAAPAPTADAAGVLKAGASIGAAVATGGLSLLAQGLVSAIGSNDQPCAVALGRRPKKSAATSAKTSAPETKRAPIEKTAETAKSVAKQATEKVEGAVKGIGGALKGLFGN